MKRNYTGQNFDIIFYDGHCGLCHRSVRFILARDSREVFHFSPLQGKFFEAVFTENMRNMLPDSIVVLTKEKEILMYSEAVVYILKRLRGIWRFLGFLLDVVPSLFGDSAYRLVAATRRKLFKRPVGLCPLIPPHLRNRFLLDKSNSTANSTNEH